MTRPASSLCKKYETKLANPVYILLTMLLALQLYYKQIKIYLVQAGKTIPANLATIAACTNVDYVY